MTNDERHIISEAMRILGKSRSEAKINAARINGAKGGRGRKAATRHISKTQTLTESYVNEV